jgi:hypothetical protein
MDNNSGNPVHGHGYVREKAYTGEINHMVKESMKKIES